MSIPLGLSINGIGPWLLVFAGFIPVIFTKPPSGTAPIPYSVSPRLMLTSFGGKKRKKRSTLMPVALAAAK